MNVAMDMIVETTDPDKQAELVRELTGPLRTIGSKVSREDLYAPAWWHGDDEAFASVEGFTLPMSRKE